MKIKQLATRQRIRKGLLLLSFLLFPITLYYFSPVLILAGASQGVINRPCPSGRLSRLSRPTRLVLLVSATSAQPARRDPRVWLHTCSCNPTEPMANGIVAVNNRNFSYSKGFRIAY